MSSTEVAPARILASEIEKVLMSGDLSKLSPDQRLSYYNAVCKSLGLNPLTKPFAYLHLNGKLVLYAQKDCTEQLRTIHAISLKLTARENIEGVYVVTANATRPDGRCDESTGAVSIEGLKGSDKANAMMKAETKAKRRVTLSICGLGMLDESEADSISGAEKEPEPTQETLIEAPVPDELKPVFATLTTAEGVKNAVLGMRASLIKFLPMNGAMEFKRILTKHGLDKSSRPEQAKAALLEMHELLTFAGSASPDQIPVQEEPAQ